MRTLEKIKDFNFLLFRHAALMAISAIGEGCHKQMESLLPQIMDGVIQYLQDPVSIQICFMILPDSIIHKLVRNYFYIIPHSYNLLG